MADDKADQGAQGQAAQAQEKRSFGIRRIYTKDVSFESPNAPHIFNEEKWAPDINIGLANQAAAVGENLHEVTLSITVTAKLGDKTVYLVEVQQSGEFQTAGFAGNELRELLGIYCPGLLFPYLREAVSGLVAKGGFPPLHLAPVNFEALYAQHMQRMQNEQSQRAN